MSNRIVYVPANSGPAYWGPGDMYTFLVSGDESGGSYFTMEAQVPHGGGPPLHIHHREEEQFYILQGEITLQAGDQTIQAPVGVLFISCAGRSTPLRMTVRIRPRCW